MKLKGEITLLVGQDYTTIRIQDDASLQTICEVTLTPEQLSQALSRLARTPCEVEVYPKAFDRLGLTMETSRLEFEIPFDLDRVMDKELLVSLANQADRGLYFAIQQS